MGQVPLHFKFKVQRRRSREDHTILRTFTILMVDDDEGDYLLLSLYCREIENCRISMEWVDTYVKAQRYVAQNTLDLLIVDYHLNSSRTGLDLALEIKASHPGLPTIMISARDLTALRATKNSAVLDGYIHKKDMIPKVLAEALCPFFG
jgi:DNA-binding response OmpR family regulator